MGQRRLAEASARTTRQILARSRTVRIPRGITSGAIGAQGGPSIARMRYCDSVALNGCALADATALIYSANGAWDPQTAVGGHQPMGFDQLMAFYQHYTVMSSVLTVDFSISNVQFPDPGEACIVGIALRDTAVFSTTSTTAREVGNITWVHLANDGSTGTAKLSKRFQLRKVFPGATASNALYRGNTVSNPTEGQFYHIYNMGDGYRDAPQLHINITIEYNCILTERRPLVAS